MDVLRKLTVIIISKYIYVHEINALDTLNLHSAMPIIAQ